MGFSTIRARIASAKHKVLGDPAEWRSEFEVTPVSVRKLSKDELVGHVDSTYVFEGIFISVEIEKVPRPQVGDLITMKDETLKVIAEPRRDTIRPEWICEVEIVG